MSKLEKAVPIIAGICGLVVIGAVLIWAPPCSGVLELANGNAVPMRCSYTAKVAVLLGIALVALAVTGLATRKPLTMPIIIVAIAMIAVTFESFMGIGICKKPMACWTTAAWIRACAGVTIIAALVGAIGSANRKKVPAGK